MKKSINLAVIGAGHWGPNLIRNFHTHPQSRVSWVCDLDAGRLEAIKGNYEGISVSNSWETVLQKPDVDAVVICTPTASHYRIAKEALSLGKHVFVEKPLTASYAESKELVSLAKEKNRKLMVGHVFLFNPAVQFIKAGLEKQDLGDVYYLHCTRTNLGPIRADVNALWDLASHDVSIALYLLGQTPELVSGTGAAFINPPVEDVVFGSFRFPSGTVVKLHSSWLNPKKVREITIVGSQKMLVFDDMQPETPISIFDKNISDNLSKTVINDTIHQFRKSIFLGSESRPRVPFSEPLKNECNAFVDWLMEGPAPATDGGFGAQVVRVLEAMQSSISQLGAPVRLHSSLGK